MIIPPYHPGGRSAAPFSRNQEKTSGTHTAPRNRAKMQPKGGLHMSLQWYKDQIADMLKQIRQQDALAKVYTYVRFLYMKR